MLEEHKRTGVVKNIKHCAQIRTAYAFCQSSIIAAVMQKASSMAGESVPELVAAVEK